MTLTTGCSRTVKPGDKAGYDEGEQYLSLWVHIIEGTPEGQAYLESVNSFNEHYDGRYFAEQSAVVENAEVMGNENNLYFTFGGAPAVARVSKYEISRAGDTIDFVFVPSKLHFFDKETETCLF
mgnify:FL=1|jgi:sugar ABC transporter, ATP-binding protein